MNVLSIDIDYAYSPTISAYDDYVEGSRVSLAKQLEIFKENNLPLPAANQSKLDFLKQIIVEKTDSTTPIVIAEHHHQILPFLPSVKPYQLFNFDHHHDVYYPGWHSLDELDEGNWVYFLRNSPMIKYVWIRNEDSENLPPDLQLNFELQEIYEPTMEEFPKFDLVFACSSEHWTGTTGRKHLFEVLGAER